MTGEAQYIHRALFPRQTVPAAVVARYEAARARFFFDDAYAHLVAFLAEHRLDAEAVEYALRLRHGPNGLTRRFQVMLTLCEVRSAYDAAFVQREQAAARAWSGAPWMALRAAWKLGRGMYLMRTHRLDRLLHV
ncbi:MAG TPA: hypothetical protein VGK29_09365 [Paludibaculum sp.]|jgi:hypothetical protein